MAMFSPSPGVALFVYQPVPGSFAYGATESRGGPGLFHVVLGYCPEQFAHEIALVHGADWMDSQGLIHQRLYSQNKMAIWGIRRRLLRPLSATCVLSDRQQKIRERCEQKLATMNLPITDWWNADMFGRHPGGRVKWPK